MNFAISDEHYYHKGMITNCGRPFKNFIEMNNSIIEKNNQIVTDSDHVYHIGDFTYSDANLIQIRMILKKLKGSHHLILGNHDMLNPRDYIEAGFISVHTSLWIEEMVMVHDPSVYTFYKKELGILVHGHVHDLYVTIPHKPVVNVSVENFNYCPVSFDKIRELVS